MKKAAILVIFLLFLSDIVFANEPKYNNTLSIVYAHNWKPYSYKDENGVMRGILIDLANEVLVKKLNMKIKHIGQPWKRAQNSVKDGVYDALITAPSKERLEYLISTKNELYSLQWRVFVSKKSKYYDEIINMKDPLKSNKFSFISLLGDKTSEAFYKEEKLNFLQVQNIDNAIKMLAIGRTDIFIHSKAIMLANLNRLNLNEKVQIHDKEYKKIPFTFLLSKKSKTHEDILPRIDHLIDTMKKNNSYVDLLNKLELNNK